MQITKRNGYFALFDTDKIANSILKANADTPVETITAKEATALAELVFARVTEENEIVTTQDVRSCVSRLLREKGLLETAAHYEAFLAKK